MEFFPCWLFKLDIVDLRESYWFWSIHSRWTGTQKFCFFLSNIYSFLVLIYRHPWNSPMCISLAWILLLATKRVLTNMSWKRLNLKKIHLMPAVISMYLLISTHLKWRDFLMLTYPCIPAVKSAWSCITLEMYCWIQFIYLCEVLISLVRFDIRVLLDL